MYFEESKRLASLLSLDAGHVGDDGEVRIVSIPFDSDAGRALRVETHPAAWQSGETTPGETGSLAIRDESVRENRSFTYPVVLPSGERRANGAILLFHGLNEKSWVKYLPWAKRLAVSTGKAVLLFPIAFHMNRAPAAWSNPRLMVRVAAERQQRFAPLAASSFVNAALSDRLQSSPERFLHSGLQTYYDVAKLLSEIREGRHPLLAPGARIDLFGYSIGAFLAEVLLFADPGGHLSESKAFLFCGGATLGGMEPVSRYILDSRAGQELASYFGGRLDAELASDSPMSRLFERIQSLGTIFRSLLDLDRLKSFRESKLLTLGRRIIAVALAKDQVVPADAVARTLSTNLEGERMAAARIRLLDFSHPYSHENPFPILPQFAAEIARSFEGLFSLASDFLA